MVSRREGTHHAKLVEESGLSRWCCFRVLVSRHIYIAQNEAARTDLTYFSIAGCFNLALFFLPIYFQAVRGVTAVSSGVRLIPIILGLAITQIAVGGLMTATGIHNPFLILGPAIAAVASGLHMLLDEQSSAGRWIGFQIILGVGVGFCLTIPLMLSQVVVKTKDVSTATPVIICTSHTRFPGC